jgi:hypothetical protein
MDIEGRVRQLPLFEPPIDPALLVRARAAGVDLSAVLAGLYAPLPLRRFELLLRRAQDLAAEVRALGGELLAALEKRDNERLSLLRSDHEIVLLDKVREAKRTAIDEARETSASLQHALAAAELKFDYYEKISREGELPGEKEAENQAKIAGNFEIVGSVLESVAGVLKAIPQIQVGPDGPKTEIGGVQFGGTVEAIGQTFSLRASVAKLESASLERKASWDRRDDEWEHQLTLARAEVAQVTKQIAAADLKQALAERELESHDLQREQSREVRSFLREKFTDEELHGWMTSELATVHFQAYQLAYEAARRAEAAFRFELGLTSTDYVSFGYWDDLRKGLLAGEKLALDLRRLESAWIERDRRDYELTRHVSLVLHDPSALIELKATGHCTIDLPETFFDADYPNHYFRRIKNVTVTIPCVTGPHTPINCTLTLEKSRVRADVTGATADNHAEQPPFGDSRFLYDLTPTRSIATSGAQNDSGMFELSFRDERYLPFEGAGAISTWKLELPPENNAIDLDTITDVVLRIDYTAREGGELLRGAANAHLEKLRTQSPEDEGTEGVVPLRPRLQRLFSLRHEFPDAWHAFLQPLDPTALRTLDLALTAERFPYLFRGRSLQAHRIDLVLVRPPGVEHPPLLELEVVDPDDASAAVELVAPQAPQRFAIATFSLDVPATGRWRIRTTPGTDVARLTRSTVSDLLLRVEYFLLPAP